MDRYRVVHSGFSVGDMPPLEPDENMLRIQDRLTDDEYRHVASLLAQRPDAWLHLCDRAPDVEHLVHFTGLRRVMVNNLRLADWSGIRHVAESLESLQMGDTTLKPISILPIGDLSNLTSLGLIGPVADAHVLDRLTGITELSLRSVTLPDLGVVMPMTRLRSLYLGLGGTADLGLLPGLRALEKLELWRIRGLRDVSVLGSLPTVRSLSLQSMSAITSLPSFAGCGQLRRVALDTMKGITDLRPVAAAPRLEELLLIAMPQLSPADLEPLVGHRSLRRGVWGLGSGRKNSAAYDLLPVGDPPYGHPKFDEWMARLAEQRAADGVEALETSQHV